MATLSVGQRSKAGVCRSVVDLGLLMHMHMWGDSGKLWWRPERTALAIVPHLPGILRQGLFFWSGAHQIGRPAGQ